MASYKIPVRIIELAKLPRISGSKLDKKALLKLTLDE
jgi:non-ribosomal peptide synthetase component E (peptide arylation enzyme)